MASSKPSPLFVRGDPSIGSCVVCQLTLCLTVYQLKCSHRICGRCNIEYTQDRTKDTNCPGDGIKCSTTHITNSNHKWVDTAINNTLLEEELPCETCGKPVKRKNLSEHQGGEGCLTAKEKEQLSKRISTRSRNTIVLQKLSQLPQEIIFEPFIWKIDIKSIDAFDISDCFYFPQFGWRMALVRMCYSNEEHRKFMTVHLFIFKGETYIPNSPPLRCVIKLSLLGQSTSPEHLQDSQGHDQSTSPEHLQDSQGHEQSTSPEHLQVSQGHGQSTSTEHLQDRQGHGQSTSTEHLQDRQGHNQDGSLSKSISICVSEDTLIPEHLVVAEEQMQSNCFCREGFVYIEAEVIVNNEIDSGERSTEVKTFPETGEFAASSLPEVESIDH